MMQTAHSPSAPLFRPARSGTPRNVLGIRHLDKVSPKESAGAFLLTEITVPAGCGAPMHRHHVDAECFYLLEGELVFVGPSGSFTAAAGDTCFLPRMGLHGFRNESDRPARALVITSPGRDAEAFFAEIDMVMEAGDPDPATVTEIAARHRLTVLPGVPAR